MHEEGIKLLKEVNSGCKNATDSFGQVREFVKDETLLNDQGKDEKDPPSVAKAMMWVTTEVKMLVDDDDSHIAELLADGCNMGIKSLSRYIRQYKKAGQRELALAGSLIDLEFELYKKLMAYL